MVLSSDEMTYLRRPGEGRRKFSVEIGRRPKADLARADTPHRAPAALVVAAERQATTFVEQVVLEVAIERGSRPPVAAGAGTAERATEVVATIDRRESGGVASNAAYLTIGWESPALGADVLGGICLSLRADCSCRGSTVVVVAAVGGVAADSRASFRIGGTRSQTGTRERPIPGHVGIG